MIFALFLRLKTFELLGVHVYPSSGLSFSLWKKPSSALSGMELVIDPPEHFYVIRQRVLRLKKTWICFTIGGRSLRLCPSEEDAAKTGYALSNRLFGQSLLFYLKNSQTLSRRIEDQKQRLQIGVHFLKLTDKGMNQLVIQIFHLPLPDSHSRGPSSLEFYLFFAPLRGVLGTLSIPTKAVIKKAPNSNSSCRRKPLSFRIRTV